MSDTAFTLDERLAADTIVLGSTPSSELLLMDDARWPWLILVPRIADATELHALDRSVRAALGAETDRVAAALQAATGCRSINVATIGNVVAQLHVHVVARDPADPNWPRPVWGHERAQRRDKGDLPAFAVAVRTALIGQR